MVRACERGIGKYRAQIIRFAALWIFVVIWQVCVVLFAVGSFMNDFTTHEFVLYILSHVSSFGYLFCHIPWCDAYFHTIHPLDMRWMAGFAIMLQISFLAIFSKHRAMRITAGLLFALLHIMGSFCSFINMGCDVT